MMKHVVCFKLKDRTQAPRAREVLLSMEGRVEQIRSIQVGLDFLASPRSYDVILEVVLENREALESYQNHPYHVDVVKEHMHRVAETSVSIDYELD